MYQACWWNEHPMYQAVMIRHNEKDIYVHDFVMYSHPAAGNAIGRIETLYVNVLIPITAFSFICSDQNCIVILF